MAGRSRRPRPPTQGPRLPAARLWLQACPRWRPRCRRQVGSCGTQPVPSASSSLPGACAAGSWHWRPNRPQSRPESTRDTGQWLLSSRSRCCHRRQRGCPQRAFVWLSQPSLPSSSFLSSAPCGAYLPSWPRTGAALSFEPLARATPPAGLPQTTHCGRAWREVPLPSRPSAPSRPRERPFLSFRLQAGQSGGLR